MNKTKSKHTRQEAGPTEYKAFPFEVTNLDFEGRTLEGYASIFGNLDSGGDIVHKGAFTKTLKERGGKVKFLWQHDSREPLGRPLVLQEDDRGLFVKAIVSKTRRGLDTLELLRDGAINEFSIGYDAIKGGTDYSEGADGNRIRNLREIKLYEFSLVTFAMNEEAQVTALKEQEAQEGDGPDEGKPAPDVTENTIRIRVHDPGDFDENAFGEGEKFRTINIGSEDNGIQATIGKLKGETATTIQGYIFDKEKFSTEEAQAWVDEHKKDASIDLAYALYAEALGKSVGGLTDEEKRQALGKQEDEGPYQCECIECGHIMESEEHCRDVKCPECGGEMRRKDRPGVGKEGGEPDEVKFVGSPRNPYGTHASRGYPGGRSGWKRAWIVYLSNVNSQGPIQGTVRRVSMIAAGMKPKCNLPEMSAEDLGSRSGACGGLDGKVYQRPSDYGLDKWKTPGDDNLEREDIQLTCQDLEDIKRVCLKEIAKRQACREDEEGKSEWADGEPQFEDKEADRIWLWEIAASWNVADSIMLPWGETSAPAPDARTMLNEAMDKMKEMLDEEKAGRVLAARNATRIANALTALIEVLEDAGVDIPGYGKESPDDEEAGPEKSDNGPPTSVDTDEANKLRNQARTLELEMELMQMTTEV